MLALALTVVAAPAAADDLGALRDAAALCMSGYPDPATLPQRFAGAGFSVAPGMDPGQYEVARGTVWGLFEGDGGQLYCTFQSPSVPLAATRPAVRALAEELFPPAALADGHPERGVYSPCAGFTVQVPRRLGWVHYAQAGNSGECVEDGTTAIIMNF